MHDTPGDTLKVLPDLPRDQSGPIFQEPWEAQAFAMAVALHAKGIFTWTEWAETLSQEIKSAQQAGDPDRGNTYYRHWLSALERIVVAKGLTDPSTLSKVRDAWEAAARSTPHGQPIELPRSS